MHTTQRDEDFGKRWIGTDDGGTGRGQVGARAKGIERSRDKDNHEACMLGRSHQDDSASTMGQDNVAVHG